MKIAIQMDPIEDVDIDGDTSFDLALNAFGRGAEVWVYGPRELSLLDRRVTARARRVTRLERKAGDHVDLDPQETLDLHSLDVVLMRQDPPFDMSYITATHILEHLQPEVLVVNDPAAVRNAPEKLFVTHFDGLMPPTLISADEEAIRAFRAAHGDIILKPLYGNGGAGVFRIKPDDPNMSSLLEMFTELYREPVIAQAYVPAVTKGDKRIILIDGEAVGAINRVPAEGETRSNMHVGGRPEPVDMTARDQEICDAIGPALKEQGLVIVGIDVIGDYLTEINVTSPTGFQEVRRFGGADISALFWDWAEGRLSKS
ncbi:MAG: glutathione synthase [Pseudomonadota bacterium]